MFCFKCFTRSGIFIIVELPNKHGIRTTQQFLTDVPESQALEERLGLSVIKSPFTLQNVGGAYALKTYTKDLLLLVDKMELYGDTPKDWMKLDHDVPSFHLFGE